VQQVCALIFVLILSACSSKQVEPSSGISASTPAGMSAPVLPTAAGTGASGSSQPPARVPVIGGAGAPAAMPSVGVSGASAPAAQPTAGAAVAVGGASAAAGSVAVSAAGAGGGSAVSAAGSGGTSAAGMGAAGAAGGGTQSVRRSCVKAGSEVVNIGDSYSNYAVAHMPMVTFMTERARKDGALAAGDSYLDYAQFGTTLAAAPAEIPNQWERAKAKLPI
jgi:hypothetical protein